MPQEIGTLWIVATPIGNLRDLSPRAVELLASVAQIAAEDTRHTAGLLAHWGIKTPCVSVHEHNEADRAPKLIERLASGEDIALVSDAGTPLISDPGYRLVRAVRAAGVAVHTVPGPCAAIAALSIAGLPTDRFAFEGFLPARAAQRRKRLAALVDETRTLVVYESSHRIVACAEDLAATFGQRSVTLARELTKRYEQTINLPADEIASWLSQDSDRQRGEFVLVIAGASAPPDGAESPGAVSLDALLAEIVPLAGTKKAAAIASRLTGVAKKTAYARALSLDV